MSAPKPIRWWPAAIISALGAAAYLFLIFSPTENQQERTFQYLLVIMATGLLLFLWAMLFSRLGWKRKLGVLGTLIALVAAMAGLFRIESVSGDMVPILAFRWSGPDSLEGGAGAAAVETSPNDFPQFLGQNRTGEVAGVTLDPDWEANPPKELWRRKVGDACSGFVVVGNAAVTFEQRRGDAGAEQVVVRYDLETGDVVWSHGLPGAFESVIGGNGPRSTPTVADGKVFAFGPLGTLRALDLVSGSLVWQRDVAGDHGVKRPEWGFASSPLVIDGEGGPRVVVSIGARDASLLAFRADTGEPVWQAGDDRVGYSSPVLRTVAGVDQIVIFNGSSVAGHDPATGDRLWTYPWSGDQPNVALPLVIDGDKLLVSSGYGIGSELLQLAPTPAGEWSVSQVWQSPRLKAKFTNPVIHGGRVYGLDDGVMVCIDPADGSRCWKRGRYGHGQNLLVGDKLIVQGESGEVMLVEATPEAFNELATLEALDGKSWNPPALSGRFLLVRNSTEAVVYELPTLG
ncbi:MAG: PQQ-binding-like beta-propeller repeat protein [Acidobacteriota bacterium]